MFGNFALTRINVLFEIGSLRFSDTRSKKEICSLDNEMGEINFRYGAGFGIGILLRATIAGAKHESASR